MAGTVMEQIGRCLNDTSNFLLSGGAGSGKTYTLIQTLHYVFKNNPKSRVACITYTNVAANEIKERSPYSKLHVSTIHDFLWGEIMGYQKNLKQAVLHLIFAEKQEKGAGLSYSGETEITAESFACVEYQNYRDLEHGIISHDDLLKVANYMFATYPLLSKLLCNKYDYIFIDEYQDTQKQVIEIFLNYIKTYAKSNLCIGFFGDRMQSIYESGVGNIQPYIDSGDVCEIIKEDNYRCAIKVIELLNTIRIDLTQRPAKLNPDGSIANKVGSAIFVYSDMDFDLDAFKASDLVADWDFEDSHNTKVLLLTHKLSATRLGFAELLSAYKYADDLIGNEPDLLARQLLKIGGILYHYERKNYPYVTEEIEQKIKTNSDKKRISSLLAQTLKNLESGMSIETLIDEFDKSHLVRKGDLWNTYLEKRIEVYDKVKGLPALQVLSYFVYYNDFSPYSTQHGVKGAEFDNVLVVMDNGKWNSYNFKYYFEKTSGKESIIERTERLFYVCCSRAKENLIVYYPNPTQQIIAQAKKLFGENNVRPISGTYSI